MVANIVADVHVRLMDAYADLMAANGRLLLGGVLDRRADQVLAAAKGRGFRLESTAARDDWRLLAFTAPAPRGGAP